VQLLFPAPKLYCNYAYFSPKKIYCVQRGRSGGRETGRKEIKGENEETKKTRFFFFKK
jgi:hypothetical protein